eukprot:768396-Hanusia_phi.AAC.2
MVEGRKVGGKGWEGAATIGKEQSLQEDFQPPVPADAEAEEDAPKEPKPVRTRHEMGFSSLAARTSRWCASS